MITLLSYLLLILKVVHSQDYLDLRKLRAFNTRGRPFGFSYRAPPRTATPRPRYQDYLDLRKLRSLDLTGGQRFFGGYGRSPFVSYSRPPPPPRGNNQDYLDLRKLRSLKLKEDQKPSDIFDGYGIYPLSPAMKACTKLFPHFYCVTYLGVQRRRANFRSGSNGNLVDTLLPPAYQIETKEKSKNRRKKTHGQKGRGKLDGNSPTYQIETNEEGKSRSKKNRGQKGRGKLNRNAHQIEANEDVLLDTYLPQQFVQLNKPIYDFGKSFNIFQFLQ